MKTPVTFKPRLNPALAKKPPKGLSPEASSLWKKLLDEYAIDDEAAYLLLQVALESFDRMREAQVLLRVEGLTFRDRHGAIKQHPAVAIERDSRSGMLFAFRQLHLDLEPLRDQLGRPGA